MTKRSDLEIQQYVAAKETMVKDQVDIVVLIADGDPFLPGFKTKAGTQFQEEGLGLSLNARRRPTIKPSCFRVQPRTHPNRAFWRRALSIG